MRKLSISAAASCCLFAAIKPAAAQVPISTVYTGGPGTYTLSGTVTSVLNAGATSNTITLQDASGSIIAYSIPLTDYTATVGDNITLNGVTDVSYQGSPEISNTGLTTASIVKNSSGNAVTYPSITVPQFVAAGNGSTLATANPPLAESIVTLHDVKLPAGTTSITAKTTYVLTDGSPSSTGTTTNMYTYTSDSAVASAVTAANTAETNSGGSLFAGLVDITGYTDVYYGVPEIYPLSINVAAPDAIPEPASISMLTGGAMILLNRRRRSRMDTLPV